MTLYVRSFALKQLRHLIGSKPHGFTGKPHLKLRLAPLRLKQYYLSAIHIDLFVPIANLRKKADTSTLYCNFSPINLYAKSQSHSLQLAKPSPPKASALSNQSSVFSVWQSRPRGLNFVQHPILSRQPHRFIRRLTLTFRLDFPPLKWYYQPSII